MFRRVVRVVAPSRLHFGLLSFGRESGRQFGGVGAMIDIPSLRLCVRPGKSFHATGPLASRAVEFANRWAAFHKLAATPPCQIEVASAPREHAGLGVGTQLGLSVAAALNALVNYPPAAPTELAVSVGRGERSAIGTYGFCTGGLIVDRGKLNTEPVAPLDCHVELPAAWRFVLICPPSQGGLSGDVEHRAFARLPAVPAETTDRLEREIRDRMIPAAVRSEFVAFSESVFDYSRWAGMCFADLQGGPYNGPLLAEIVAEIRALGVPGVGQSSWGPTIFAVLPTEVAAFEIRDRLRLRFPTFIDDIWISAPNNAGATITVTPSM